MGTKQLPGLQAPDGSFYVTITDGSGNLLNTRTVLTADATFHVETPGNGGNDSTATGSVSLPFATIQACYKYIATNFDFDGHNVFMQIGPGTFTSGLDLAGIGSWVGGGSLQIDGTPATDGSTHHLVTQINMTGTAFNFNSICVGSMQVGLMYFASSGNLDCISVTTPNTVFLAAVEFGPAGTGRHCVASTAGANIIFNDGSSNYITGLSGVNFLAINNGYIQLDNQNFTIAGNAIGTGTPPNATVVFEGLNGGAISAQNINWNGTTWNNAASVFKYLVSINGVLNTGNTIASIPGALSIAQIGGVTDQSGTFTALAGKQFVALNTMLVAAGADGQTFTFPAVTDTVSCLGTAQTFSALNTYSTPVRFTPITVASLPAAVAGKTGMVSDSTVAIGAGLGLAPIGGGANVVPVFCDQTPAWKIG